MKLEKAIQQTRFTSNEQKLSLNFIYTYNCFKQEQKLFFNTYGITSQQYNVLRILRGSHPEPLSTSQIRNRMLDKMSDASRIVDRLLKKELVNRTTTKTDKRLVDVVISYEGLKLLGEMDKPLEEHMANSFKRLSQQERITLYELLDKMRVN